MQVLSRPSGPERLENLIHRLVARLSRHILWDSLLLFGPLATAVVYVLLRLFQAGWLSPNAAIAIAILTLGLGAFAVSLRGRPLVPSVRRAAGLVDQRSGAKDHFLTLATIDSARQPTLLLTRLRLQTEGFLNRIELRRDFPYEFKRSAKWSLGASSIVIILIHLLFLVAQPARYSATVQQQLREIAQQMATKPRLSTTAKELQDLASKLDDAKIPPDKKQAFAQDMEQKLTERQKKEEEKDHRDLLGQAASALDGMEKQQRIATGQDRQTDQQKGGGGIQSNAPQNGQGENKQSQGGSGESKGDSTAQSQEKMDQGKSAQSNPKEKGSDKSQAGDTKNDRDQPDPDQPGKDPNKEKAGKTERGSKDGAGKQQPSEEPPPQGGPQTDRFYKPGEGKEGLARKGYVTVQMPEELVADAKGESRATKESKNNRSKTQVPVSNVPLPAHVPNVPTEKQQVPIEYRGILR